MNGDSIILNSNLFKDDDTIKNIKDFEQILNIVNYSDINPYHKYFINYIHNNKKICMNSLLNLGILINSLNNGREILAIMNKITIM